MDINPNQEGNKIQIGRVKRLPIIRIHTIVKYPTVWEELIFSIHLNHLKNSLKNEKLIHDILTGNYILISKPYRNWFILILIYFEQETWPLFTPVYKDVGQHKRQVQHYWLAQHNLYHWFQLRFHILLFQTKLSIRLFFDFDTAAIFFHLPHLLVHLIHLDLNLSVLYFLKYRHSLLLGSKNFKKITKQRRHLRFSFSAIVDSTKLTISDSDISFSLGGIIPLLLRISFHSVSSLGS